MKTPYLILDIETGPLPEEKQREIMPSEWPLGNVKDPEKVKAAIAEKERAWLESSTLDATRCEIIAVGVKSQSKEALFHGKDEKTLIEDLYDTVYSIDQDKVVIVGHRLLGFDVPMIVRRGWKHGLRPPDRWLNCTAWKADWAFDTAEKWSCGNREQCVSLKTLAWHLGVGIKDGSGKDFHRLYKEDQKAALEYLSNDLRLTEAVYLRMCL